MKQKWTKQMGTLLALAVLVAALTACGSGSGIGNESGGEIAESTSSPAAESLSDAEFEDGSLGSAAWRDGVVKLNGTVYRTTETTLEQIGASGYQTDQLDYILGVKKQEYITMSDGAHQEIKLLCSNFSEDKPLYAKHAVITSYAFEFAVKNGLAPTDAVLPGNIKEGMTKDEIAAIVGTPEDITDSSLRYRYRENDRTLYSIWFNFDSGNKLSKVEYDNSMEHLNVTDDSGEIAKTLDTTVETAKTAKSKPSEALKDAEIMIGSQVYTMPLNMQDLIEIGYKDQDNGLQEVLNSGQSGGNVILGDKGGNVFYAEAFENISDRPRALSHCWISELSFTKKAEKVSIAKGIKVGSTAKDVTRAFGKKEKRHRSSYYWLVYEYTEKRGEVQVAFAVDKETDKVKQINMTFSQLHEN